MQLDIKNYPGSKNATGLPQFIVNNTPDFSEFYELFGGTARIARTFYEVLPDKTYIVYERSRNVFIQLVEKFKGISFACGDGLEYLKRDLDRINYVNAFVYLDPPYTKTSRRSSADIYEFEWTMDQHVDFLEFITSDEVQFNCMISHYPDELYDKYLKGWTRKTIQVMTRGGIATEVIYMNYDPSEMPLATYDKLGEGFTDRQRIKRRKSSYLGKFKKMPFHERQAILEHIQNNL